MSADFPLCFSCRSPMDPETGKKLEGAAPMKGRACERLCLECLERIEKEEKERSQWPQR